MLGENSPHNAKVDTWMPLDIGRFLQDTMHLSSTQIGNYILLLMHYWSHGAMENDPAALARIARESPDAWSIAQAKLSMFFSIGEDGLLHQAGADRRIAEWRTKRQKAKEKASKAARARWDRYRESRANKQEINDAPSIAQAMPEQCPSPVVQVQEQKQKQKQKIPPTPTAGAAGEEASQGDAPSMQVSTTASWPAGIAGEVLGAGRELAAGILAGAQESINKAKTPEMASAARPNGRLEAEPHLNGEVRLARPVRPRDAGFNLPLKSSKADPRKEAVKSEVLAYCRGQNPDGPELELGRADDRAIDDLLRKYPKLAIKDLKKCLHNRFESEVNPAALPHKWLRSILEYAAGPLDKYMKPKRPLVI